MTSDLGQAMNGPLDHGAEEQAGPSANQQQEYTPEIPYLWPEARVLTGQRHYSSPSALEAPLARATYAFGLARSIRGAGIKFIRTILKENLDLRWKLIVGVYPACGTKREDLEELNALVKEFDGRFEVRVKPFSQVTNRPANVLCIGTPEDVSLTVSGNENLGFDARPEGKIDTAFQAPPPVQEAVRRYFDFMWAQSASLDRGISLEIPDLTLPEGTEEARQMWLDYLERCQLDAEAAEERAVVDPETGEVHLHGKTGEPVESPTAAIGVTILDPIQDAIARLYEQGDLVTVDKGSRVIPLDAPADPRWFGDSAELQRGSIRRTVSMRISVFDEKVLKALEKKRKAAGELLSRFSIRLADGVRWMPRGARNLLWKELDRVAKEGREMIVQTTRGDAASFIDGRIGQIRYDALQMYKEIGGRGDLPEGAMTTIVTKLRERIDLAAASSFQASLTFTGVQFRLGDGDNSSPWGQARTLLAELAECPRKAYTDPFFFRGLRIEEKDYLEAMDAARDQLLRAGNGVDLRSRAEEELGRLKDIVSDNEASDQDKCRAIWKLIRGDGRYTPNQETAHP